MAASESIDTMQQNSYVQLADGSYATQNTQTIAGTAQDVTSISDANTVNAPASGATLATVTVPNAGSYDIEVWSFIGGTTVAATEVLNMRLRQNTTAVSRIVNPVPGTTGAVGTGTIKARIKANAGDTINVVAVSAATASSVYTCCLVARRVS